MGGSEVNSKLHPLDCAPLTERMQGIYALSQRLEQFVDLKVAIRGGVHFDLVKRVRSRLLRTTTVLLCRAML